MQASRYLYRVVSVGLDCQLALWDVDMEDEVVAVAVPSGSPVPRCALKKKPIGMAFCNGHVQNGMGRD